jgi:pyruvate formate lyase activating enzyme
MTLAPNGMKAVLWDSAPDLKVQCKLCAHRCLIADGKTGRCCVRKNVEGILYSLSYGKICAANADPIEKKPLFHFLPGSQSFSVATEGCNLRCEFCQNWQISQAPVEQGHLHGQRVDLRDIVHTAIESQCQSIAYTYTEPTVFMELCAECGRLAKSKGIANVFVSNGYQTRKAIDFAKEWLDGINVDLKAFDPAYYRTLCHAELQPVLDTIEYIARDTDIWLEITTLVIPGQNDAEDQLKQLADFLVTKAGPDVPWHVSRFHPQYKFQSAEPTPIAILERAYEIGKQAGLNYVYLGNVPGSQTESTFCPQCNKLLIERIGYTIRANHLQQGCCPDCSTRVAGVF